MTSEYPPRAPENGASFTDDTHAEAYPFLRSATHANHRVLITGGSRGIGRAIALSFAGTGAQAIAIADIATSFGDLASDLNAAAARNGNQPPQVILTQVDVTSEESVRQCARIVKEEFEGQLDVLVNNAGFMTPAASVPDANAGLWWRTMEVNLKGVFHMAKYFIPLLKATPDGPRTLININSVAAHNLRPMASAYGTSKFAVLKLTEFLMVEAKDSGLVAYSVHPGAVLTELAEKGMPRSTLAGLTDSVDLAGATVAWLSSEKREWLAGRYISATWDMEEILRRKDEIVAGDKLKVRLVV
ncbi:oxidoreductase-like protein [Xylariaceae sp. FL0016]|nr:oxidoreductase-like protein [Xylariaceae sp. FL0016]